jgi:predicted nucleotidyltransferase
MRISLAHVVLPKRALGRHNTAMADEVDQLLTAVAKALSPLQEVRAALLFGSRAKGRARPDSDIERFFRDVTRRRALGEVRLG